MLIPREVFHVSKCAARESTRYAINGIRIERGEEGKCRAITTDGRRLVFAEWSDEHTAPEYPPIRGAEPGAFSEGDGVVIDPKLWNEAAKTIPKNGGKPILHHCHLDEGAILRYREAKPAAKIPAPVRLTSTDLDHERSIEGREAEGNFPTWQHILPQYTVGVNAVEIGVNPAFMAECCKVVEATATDEESKGVRLVIPTDPNRPMLVEGRSVNTGVEGKAVIMPVNIHATDKTVVGQAPKMLSLLELLVSRGLVRQLEGLDLERRDCELCDDIRELVAKFGEDWATDDPSEDAETEGSPEEAEPETAATEDLGDWPVRVKIGSVEPEPDPDGFSTDGCVPYCPPAAPDDDREAVAAAIAARPDGVSCKQCGALAPPGKKFCQAACYYKWLGRNRKARVAQ